MRKVVYTAAAVLLLLAGCGERGPAAQPGPTQTPSGPSAPASPAPEASPSPALTLADFPVDDTHDAFAVDTGGSLGELLVALEWDDEGELFPDAPFTLRFTVWDPLEPDQPLQTLTMEDCYEFGPFGQVVDANFDGYMDFGYPYSLGASNAYYWFWLWDEEQGQFVEAPELADLSRPWFDAETQTVSSSTHSSAVSSGQGFYRWEEGELVLIRSVAIDGPAEDGSLVLTVKDRAGGVLTQVYHESFMPEEEELIFDEAARWSDLDYHGGE